MTRPQILYHLEVETPGSRRLLRLWNDAAWQRAEREREEREMLELAHRLPEWDGRAEELPRPQ